MNSTQKCILKLYKKFRIFCQENNIHFYGVAGTAIGAVRHNGFIPWDDDLDVGMPIEDFERFKKLCKEHLPKDTGFYESMWMGGKFYDTNTTIIDVRMLTNPKQYHGVYIDIFPLIGTPDDEIERDKFEKELKSYSTNSQLYEFYPEISPFSKKELLDWRNYLLTAYDFNTSKKVAAFCYFLNDGNGIRNPIEVDFEDTKMPLSSNYDWDLSNHFGDYMTPPPKEEQHTHTEYHLADLKKSFQEYAKEYESLPDWVKDILKKKQAVEGRLTQYSNSLKYEADNRTSLQVAKNPKKYRLNNIVIAPLKKIKRMIKQK